MMSVELLLPAGSRETLETAVRYGADAVYLGGKTLSLRAKARNFSLKELEDAVSYAHEHGVLVYFTANIFARDADLEEADRFFRELAALPERSHPDAVLVTDPGMLGVVRKHCPSIPLHLSTQANVTNAASCRFWHDAGISRAVLARELSIDEIERIRKGTPGSLSLECFVHGAMCISYSGRCLLSRALTGRDANRGACAHPCRYNYVLSEEKRPGEYYPIEEDPHGTEILASEDLCMISHLPELISAGIESFKVEGRMKNALYVAGVARAYRRAIDLLFCDQQASFGTVTEAGLEAYHRELPELLREVREVATRPMATGFFLSNREQIDPPENPRCFLGVVSKVNEDSSFEIMQRNRFAAGEELVVMKACDKMQETARERSFSDVRLCVRSIIGEDGAAVPEAVHPKEKLVVYADICDRDSEKTVEAGDVIFRY
ncbi:MAG: U32 family peptidase [Lachnospiraceae bacterium]|nr:U32 family peptidase [Lachnospiraceae bacterium]